MQIDGVEHEITARIDVWTECVKIVLIGPENGAGAFELEIPHHEILAAASKIMKLRKVQQRHESPTELPEEEG